MRGNPDSRRKGTPQIARFMGPTWGPSGADRTQVGPMLALWALLSGGYTAITQLGLWFLKYITRRCTVGWWDMKWKSHPRMYLSLWSIRKHQGRFEMYVYVYLCCSNCLTHVCCNRLCRHAYHTCVLRHALVFRKWMHPKIRDSTIRCTEYANDWALLCIYKWVPFRNRD